MSFAIICTIESQTAVVRRLPMAKRRIMEGVHSNICEQRPDGRKIYRDRTELLQRRANLLDSYERLLMTMYLEKQLSYRQIARLTGTSEARVSRKINRLLKQLLESQYLTCMRNRHRFSRTQMQIAKQYFLEGLSLRQIAQKRNCSYHHIRLTVVNLRQSIEKISAKSRQRREMRDEGRGINSNGGS